MKVATTVRFEYAEIVQLLTEKAREATGVKSGGAGVSINKDNPDKVLDAITINLTSTEPKKR